MTSAGSHRAGRSRAGIRLTRRGRVTVALLIVGGLVAAFWLGAWRAGAAVAPGGDPYDRTARETVALRTGDTLWRVARQRDPDADPRAVQRIIELDGPSNAAVTAGQRIAVPEPG